MLLSSFVCRFTKTQSLYRICGSLYCNTTKATKTMPFYAVAKGVVPGVYTSWTECQKQVKGFHCPQFKKFPTQEEADQFIAEKVDQTVDRRKDAVKPSTASTSAAKSTEVNKEKKKDDEHSGDDSSKKEENIQTSKDEQIENGTERKGVKRARSTDEDDDDAKSNIKKRVFQKSIPDKDLFTVNEDGCVEVYTDGSCEFNGRSSKARAGVGVYFGDDNPFNVSEPVRGRATNNTAEIQAVTYALELIKRAGFSKAVVNTDSQFVISCMTSWLSGWKKRGWKKSDGSAVINKEDLIDLDKATDGLMVKWNHVRAHVGLPGNEKADRLAKDGAVHYKTSS